MSANLSAGEATLLKARPHPLNLLPPFLGFVALMIVLLVALSVAQRYIPAAYLADYLRYVGYARLLVIVYCLANLLVAFGRWRATSYTITNHRVILARGLISRVVISLPLDRIQDTTVRQGLGARLVGCGNILLESAGRDGVERLRLIPNAQHFANRLLDAISERRQQIGSSSGV